MTYQDYDPEAFLIERIYEMLMIEGMTNTTALGILEHVKQNIFETMALDGDL